MKIRLELLHFTEKGLGITQDRRRAIGRKLLDAYRRQYAHEKDIELALQFYPSWGFGSLSETEMNEIELSNISCEENEDGSGIVFGISKRLPEDKKSFLKAVLPRAEIVELTTLPDFEADADKNPKHPHAYIMYMDTGTMEQLSEITVTVKTVLFGKTNQERELWLENYISEIDPNKRAKMLKKLHLDSLTSPVIVPLIRTPYISVLRAPWKSSFSTSFPNAPLWKISYPDYKDKLMQGIK